MARKYQSADSELNKIEQTKKLTNLGISGSLAAILFGATPLSALAAPEFFAILTLLPSVFLASACFRYGKTAALERERAAESARRKGRMVVGMPPQRDAFAKALDDARSRGKKIIDKYLVGFGVESGEPLFVDDDEICGHGCVFAKTGVGKTLWLESLIFQQMARGRASGLTFIDAKRDSGTLAHIILMALITGRIEDLIVIDPFDPIHSYNFLLTSQRADVKARKVLRAGLPPTSDQSTAKHYDRLAADSVYRIVRAFESFGLAWSMRDVAAALGAFNLAYPQLKSMLNKIGARQALVELGHLAASYRTPKGSLDTARITDNLRGIASELHAISGSAMGEIFCANHTDLTLTDAILRGKIIYFMLPRLEEAESAARMVKVFREDLEVSIGEITSSRMHTLEDPHLVVIDEGASTFGPTWANLFELARKGRFALIFGAQSTGGLMDQSIGLSQAFYERVMANVNLKVMMRLGDNRTAYEMQEWIGKITSFKRTIGSGVSTGVSASSFGGSRTSDSQSQSLNLSETEADLVSSEELKHEMSSEKGLAWFDLGDGRIVKGRALWFNAELPENWDGREHLIELDQIINDQVGLADWVDEQILRQEQNENVNEQIETDSLKGVVDDSTVTIASQQQTNTESALEKTDAESDKPFRLRALPMRGRFARSVKKYKATGPIKDSSDEME
ncbi:MAG TPA: TraM recognition domain-containing protein [Oligoflexia bacterium]|nr:TraM recognition domain-containing protein [Oligoflexia bacterium]HMP26445.1 TraM recognition domain-containing protein [Oligoflexia bacterium]